MIPRLFSALLLSSMIAQPQPAAADRHWVYAKPEDIGYSSKRLDALKAYLATIDTTGMMGVHKGKVIFEYGDLATPGFVRRVRQGLIGLLYGKYVANGTISLDATLEELGIDDVGGLLPVEKRAKVRDILSSRSGVFHKSSNRIGGDDLWAAPARGMMGPGNYFLYNHWDFNVAGHIFEKQTGIDIMDALQKDLAEPLGMQDFHRSSQAKQTGDTTISRYPSLFISLSTRDMIRVGQLMLQNGKWAGKQVVPADWIKTITSLVTPVDLLNPPTRRMYSMGKRLVNRSS